MSLFYYQTSGHNTVFIKVTRHLCSKNSKNLQLLDVQACNSDNKAAFQNPTKSLSAQWSIDVKSVVTF